VFYLLVYLFQELELIFERLSSVLSINVQQRLIVQILDTTRPGIIIVISITIITTVCSSLVQHACLAKPVSYLSM